MNHLSSVWRKISHIIQLVLGQIVVHMYSAIYQKINKDRLYLSFWYTLFPQYFSQVQIKCCIWDIFHILKSLYQSTSLSVSEWVTLFGCSLTQLQNGEPQRPEILRDDSPWYGEGFRLKNIQIRRTISRKIACVY